MKQVILDTNFILSCIRKKIDFFEEIELMGMQITIPEGAIEELRKISLSEKKLHFREDSNLALRLLEKNKGKFKKIFFNEKKVDVGLIKFSRENKEVIIATLDKSLKNQLKEKSGNSVLMIRGQKKLEVV